MVSAQPLNLNPTGRTGSLPSDRHEHFLKRVIEGATDLELAHEFGLRERTACNYRRRAEDLARERGLELPDRKAKGAPEGTPRVDDPKAGAHDELNGSTSRPS